ncbi:hypothetical protein BY458DRAFT_558860 [Sporodiniella umbellata]|nr:hypothetical protein BY458DRAFT_558860 [Sporodiniella umbellata]
MSVNAMNGQQRRHNQQQQQHQGNDMELVQKNYRTALSELTFNSKPIITNLTIMAQENQTAAAGIVKEIESRLRINAAGQKLPILYLIDSICKNVGGIYIAIFGRNMVSVFLDAYNLSEPTAKQKFERLLQTWKNGMPGGRPVFARHIIEPIEKNIHYLREKQAKQEQIASNNIHVNPNFINKDKQLQAHSRDPRTKSAAPVKQESVSSPSISNILSQLKIILPQQHHSTQLYQQNGLNAPASQPTEINPVRQLIDQIQAILPTLPPAQASPIEQYISQIASTTTSTGSPALANTMVSTPTLTINSISPPINKSPTINTASPILHPAATASPVGKVDTADLLKSLTSMGYLDPNPTPSKQTVSIESIGPVTLDFKDLQISRPGAIELLYSAEPLQCKQCGFRYPDTKKGQQKMDAHLDSHFRQNRKMKERVKRGLSRSWFVTVDEWIHGEGGESMSQQVPTFLQDGMGNVNKSSESNNANEELINPDDYTVIKQTDEKRTCPICGETFASFWSDDEEEWMYKNAIIVADRIYHATCHTDAVKSSATNTSDIGSKRKTDGQEATTTKQQRTQ